MKQNKNKILDGRKLSAKILSGLSKKVKKLKKEISLAVILVGENPVSKAYIRQKEIACSKLGVKFRRFDFPAQIAQEKLKEGILGITQDPDNSGVIIQLPLPKNFNTQEMLNLIPPEKDVDVLSETSVGKFSQQNSPILPPVVEGIAHFLKEYKIDLKGKNILIMGAGRLVGYPLALWFLHQNATVSVLNKYSKNTASFTKKADILISGAGKPHLIKGNMIKKGAVVIDAGTSIESGKIKGDVNFKDVFKKAGYITPVPGGVGPMTVACLLENLVKLSGK